MITKIKIDHYSGYMPFIGYIDSCLPIEKFTKRSWLGRMYYRERNQIQYANFLTVCLRKIYGNETI